MVPCEVRVCFCTAAAFRRGRSFYPFFFFFFASHVSPEPRSFTAAWSPFDLLLSRRLRGCLRLASFTELRRSDDSKVYWTLDCRLSSLKAFCTFLFFSDPLKREPAGPSDCYQQSRPSDLPHPFPCRFLPATLPCGSRLQGNLHWSVPFQDCDSSLEVVDALVSPLFVLSNLPSLRSF